MYIKAERLHFLSAFWPGALLEPFRLLHLSVGPAVCAAASTNHMCRVGCALRQPAGFSPASSVISQSATQTNLSKFKTVTEPFRSTRDATAQVLHKPCKPCSANLWSQTERHRSPTRMGHLQPLAHCEATERQTVNTWLVCEAVTHASAQLAPGFTVGSVGLEEAGIMIRVEAHALHGSRPTASTS